MCQPKASWGKIKLKCKKRIYSKLKSFESYSIKDEGRMLKILMF